MFRLTSYTSGLSQPRCIIPLRAASCSCACGEVVCPVVPPLTGQCAARRPERQAETLKARLPSGFRVSGFRFLSWVCRAYRFEPLRCGCLDFGARGQQSRSPKRPVEKHDHVVLLQLIPGNDGIVGILPYKGNKGITVACSFWGAISKWYEESTRRPGRALNKTTSIPALPPVSGLGLRV